MALNGRILLALLSLSAMAGACSPGRTVDVPPFSLAVTLSRATEDRLRGTGESVTVAAYFDGDALPGQGKYSPPMRDVYLGMAERELDNKRLAHFDGVKVPQSDWQRLSDKDYFVTVNTVTSRKVFANNLLNCADPISVKISALQGKTTEIKCKLIGE